MLKDVEQYSETRYYTAIYESSEGSTYEIQWEETENLDQDWPIYPVLLEVLGEDGKDIPVDHPVWSEVAQELAQLATGKLTL